MPFANTGTGANLYYEHFNPSGEGLPIVALHGLLGTGRKDLGRVLDQLAGEGYQVIAPSLRGYGESTPKPRDFPYKFYKRDAEDVIGLLNTLQINKCHLLGYSDGGEVGLVCGGINPRRFASVATIGSIGYQGADIRPIVMGYRPGSQWIIQEEIEMHGIDDPDKFSAQWVRAMVQLIDSGGYVVPERISEMTMPVLMMLGKKDKLNPRKYAEQFLEKVTKGQIVMFDTAHPVHDEQPEQFRNVFLKHLQAAE